MVLRLRSIPILKIFLSFLLDRMKLKEDRFSDEIEHLMFKISWYYYWD